MILQKRLLFPKVILKKVNIFQCSCRNKYLQYCTNHRYLPLNGLVLLLEAVVSVLADRLGFFEGGLSAISSFSYRKKCNLLLYYY